MRPHPRYSGLIRRPNRDFIGTMNSGLEVEIDSASPNPTEVHPATHPRSRRALADAGSDWLCALCHHRLASERDRLQFGSQSEFAFTNPAGVPFLILTFSEAEGCRDDGNPTLEHTWFPGHAWSYCLCASCGQHLGWFYAGPSEFVGLIQNRIVRALNVFN
jgi:hypothetical protein